MTEFLDFNDIEIKPKFKEKYKGVPGEKHRISIIWPRPVDGKASGPFVMKKVHFAEKYFFCKDSVCCEKLGPSKDRLACLIVKYKTKKDGVIVKQEGEKLPFSFEILEWVFANPKFAQLKTLHDEWDLKSHDMIVSCDGSEQFQDLSFTPCKESLWQAKEDFKDAIYKESESLRPNLMRALGQDLSLDEIKELLGLEITQPLDTVSTEDDLDNILAEV